MSTLSEFAVDLCRNDDVQVVLAVVRPEATLERTLAALEKKITDIGAWQGEKLGSNDTLLVPNMNWRIDHHFKELERHPLMNPGVARLLILEASQRTAFHLDRSGAELQSEAKMIAASISAHYVFDRPFLLSLKRRGAKRPSLLRFR
jgi:hypothetical protein